MYVCMHAHVCVHLYIYVCVRCWNVEMEMRFYVGTDPTVEERSHAYYQEKLFLMAEGSKKKKKRPCHEAEVPLLPHNLQR